MTDFFYQRRFTLFLISFFVLLFGSIAFPPAIRWEVEAILLLQNMLGSALLFLKQPKREKMTIGVIIILGILTKLNEAVVLVSAPFLFATIYLFYFGMISIRLFQDLRRQKVVGIETISGAFTGFILMGVFFSILFLSLQLVEPSAFSSSLGKVEFPDFLYFSFITLLTIGYGDITPTLEVSKKLVVMVGLLGHFYTVFVTAIVIGKYLSNRKGK